jgi:hypothetical protein
MHAKTRLLPAGELAEAKRGFDQWRRNGRRERRIPDRLWRMAAKAAAIHGVHATARELRLNSTRLKEQLHAQGRASEETPGFVELPWPGVPVVSECILEAEDGDGRNLRIHLKGEAITQAVSLGRMLWKE